MIFIRQKALCLCLTWEPSALGGVRHRRSIECESSEPIEEPPWATPLSCAPFDTRYFHFSSLTRFFASSCAHLIDSRTAGRDSFASLRQVKTADDLCVCIYIYNDVMLRRLSRDLTSTGLTLEATSMRMNPNESHYGATRFLRLIFFIISPLSLWVIFLHRAFFTLQPLLGCRMMTIRFGECCCWGWSEWREMSLRNSSISFSRFKWFRRRGVDWDLWTEEK